MFTAAARASREMNEVVAFLDGDKFKQSLGGVFILIYTVGSAPSKA